MKKIKQALLILILAITSPAFADDVTSRIIENGGTGKFPAVMLTENSIPTHTVFRPQNIEKFKGKKSLPLIVWGNGACFDSPFEHVNFLNEIASHGFMVVAIGTLPKATGEQNKERSTSAKLTAAIDWAFAQNTDKNSPYFKKINTRKIAVAGMSCGGLQALEVAGDPRISTLIVANSGIFIDPIRGNAMPMMPQLDKTHLKKIHTPTLYLLGGPSDIAYKNGMDDVDKINHVPIFVANLDVGHGGTYAQPYGGEFGKVATAWLSWQLKGDKKSGKLFTGDTPELSKSPGWVVAKKNMK